MPWLLVDRTLVLSKKPGSSCILLLWYYPQVSRARGPLSPGPNDKPPPPPPPCVELPVFVQVTFVTSQSMAPRIRDMCRDRRVLVLGLDDGLVPESDDFMLGRVRWGGQVDRGSCIFLWHHGLLYCTLLSTAVLSYLYSKYRTCLAGLLAGCVSPG